MPPCYGSYIGGKIMSTDTLEKKIHSLLMLPYLTGFTHHYSALPTLENYTSGKLFEQ